MKWALTMGEKYLTDCEYTQAVTMFSRAIRVDDRSEPAYWGRAQAYVQMDDTDAAMSDLTYIIDELGTENADVYLTRADLYMDMGDYDAARPTWTPPPALARTRPRPKPAERGHRDRRSREHPGCRDTRRDKDSFAANQN